MVTRPPFLLALLATFLRQHETGDAMLKDAAPITRIVAMHVALERPAIRLPGYRWRGDILLGLCPFHHERTPSFTVDETEGTFHCFGCGICGTADIFISQMSIRNGIELLPF